MTVSCRKYVVNESLVVVVISFNCPVWKLVLLFTGVLIVCVEHRAADDYLLIAAQQGKNFYLPSLLGLGKPLTTKGGQK